MTTKPGVKANRRRAVTDRAVLRGTLGAFATGVTVVTVGGPAPHGMTANSFTSVSTDPPLVLICVQRDAIMHGSLTESGAFGVSVLSSCQEDVARHFADRRRDLGMKQFDKVKWLPGPHSGAPLIAGATAHFECDLWRTYDGGDHTIFLGSIASLAAGTDRDVLVFVNGAFRQLGRDQSDLTT